MKEIIIVLGVTLLLVGIFSMTESVIQSNENHDYSHQKELSPNAMASKYFGYVKMGIAPSAPSREPQKDDIDTGIKLENNGKVYALYESRTFVTKDMGKSFIVRIA